MVIKSAAWLGSEAGRRGRGGSEAGGRGAEEARAAALRGHADARELAQPGPVHSQGPREQRLILYILSYKDDFSMYILSFNGDFHVTYCGSTMERSGMGCSSLICRALASAAWPPGSLPTITNLKS